MNTLDCPIEFSINGSTTNLEYEVDIDGSANHIFDDLEKNQTYLFTVGLLNKSCSNQNFKPEPFRFDTKSQIVRLFILNIAQFSRTD